MFSLGWFVFSREVSSALLWLQGRLTYLIIQNLISVNPSVVSVASSPSSAVPGVLEAMPTMVHCLPRVSVCLLPRRWHRRGRASGSLMLVWSFNNSASSQLYPVPRIRMLLRSGRRTGLLLVCVTPASSLLSAFSGLLVRLTFIRFAVSKSSSFLHCHCSYVFYDFVRFLINLFPVVILVEFYGEELNMYSQYVI